MSASRTGLAWIGVPALAAFLLVRRLYLAGATSGMDDLALRVTKGWREGPTGRLASVSTRLGSEGLLPVATAGALAMSRGGRWRRALLPFVVLTASNSCNLALKRHSARIRPPGEPWPAYLFAWDKYAFPSGHAMNSAALFGLLAIWARGCLRGPSSIAATVSLALAPLLIGLSRVVLRVHWLSDVVAGWLAGVAVMSLVTALSHLALEDEDVPARSPGR